MTDIVKKEKDLELAKQKQETVELENLRKFSAAFHAAKRVYERPDGKMDSKIGFSIGAKPTYFWRSWTTEWDKSGNAITFMDIQYSKPEAAQLAHNFNEFRDNPTLCAKILRDMVDGQTIRFQEPDGTWVEETFERRRFKRFANTLNKVDDEVFNRIDISQRLVPTAASGECPLLYRALMYAMSGAQITWNEKTKDWDCDKQETVDWLEKWYYGAVHANIGNWNLSMPIIFGGGKVGKNALFDIVTKRILGEWCTFTCTWDTWNSNFNNFRVGKVLTFIDEIPDSDDWDKIKNATGSTTSFVKEKFGPEYEIQNCMVYAMGSNQSAYPLPFEDGEQMQRVSPIKTHKDSTFAINSVKMLNKAYGDTFCDDLLRAHDINPDKMSEHDKGDAILRSLLRTEWDSTERAQEFLNYLHGKFGKGTYLLSPLRSTDWEAIKETKIDAIEETVAFILEHRPNVIAEREAYEIYKVFMEGNDKVKALRNFRGQVKDRLAAHGYEWKRNQPIRDGQRETVFVDTVNVRRGAVANYTVSDGIYTKEETFGGKLRRSLVYPTQIQAQVARISQASSQVWT